MLRNDRKYLIRILALIVILIGITAVSVYAYFYSYFITVPAAMELELGDGKPQIVTSLGNNKVVVTIKNIGTQVMYARIKAIVPDGVQVTYSSTNGNEKGKYYYYNAPIDNASEPIEISFSTTRTDSYKSVIVAETVSALYNEQGDTYADWTATIE